MSDREITINGRNQVAFRVGLWSLVLGIISGVSSAMIGFYTTRDRMLAAVEVRVQETKQQLWSQHEADLRHYLTLERFLEWRREQDAQYYEIRGEVREIRAHIQRNLRR